MATPRLEDSLSNTSQTVFPEAGQLPGGTNVDTVLIYARNALTLVVNPSLVALTLMTSMVNVITFSRMDRSQGVTQNLLILSVSDTVYVFLGLSANILILLQAFGYQRVGKLNALKLQAIIMSAMNCPMNVSQLVTTIIAVLRCCSVAMPLSFRTIFTTKRQLVAILCSSIVITAALSYLLGTLEFMRFTFEANITFVNNIRYKRLRLVFDVFRNILFDVCLGIIVVSMVFLIVALKKSSQFQRTAAVTTKPDRTSKQSASSTSVSREAQVMKTIILILAIFVACNIPILLLSIVRLVMPDFNEFGKYRHWQNLLLLVIFMASVLNVGLNFFVYYNYNSRFKQIVKDMFTNKNKIVSEKD